MSVWQRMERVCCISATAFYTYHYLAGLRLQDRLSPSWVGDRSPPQSCMAGVDYSHWGWGSYTEDNSCMGT